MSEDLLARAEEALSRLEQLPEIARAAAEEAMHAVVAVYAEGIGRVVDVVAQGAPHLAQPLCDDELVSHLLLLHGLHPEPTEVRVERALDEVRPYLHGHGGEVELVAVDAGVAHVRLLASCDGCPSSATTMGQTLEAAVLAAAPELDAVEADGAAPPAPAPALISVEAVLSSTAARAAAS